MPCLITARTRSHIINKTTGEKINNKISKEKKHFLPEKTHSNHVKVQSGKTPTTQICFLLILSRWDFT